MDLQKTIKKTICIKGVRHSDGKKTWLKFHPSDNGLHIRYGDKDYLLSPALINFSEKRPTNSILLSGNKITTVEHIFSAVNGLGIDNLTIELESNEPPFFVDSFYVTKKLRKNIITIEGVYREEIIIDRELLIIGDNESFCKITPEDKTIIDCEISFNNIIGKQKFEYIPSQHNYFKDISRSRSFLSYGIGKDNVWRNNLTHKNVFAGVVKHHPKKGPFIAYDDRRYLMKLRYPLEPVKHKILDFIGDIAFVPQQIVARFELYKPGHKLNRDVVRILDEYIRNTYLSFDYFTNLIPEMNLLKECKENNFVHREGSVYEHTKIVFGNTLESISSNKIKMDLCDKKKFLTAVFLHDIGKLHTIKTDDSHNTTCHDHEKESVDYIIKLNLLDRLGLSSVDKEWVLRFIEKHSKMSALFDYSDKELESLFIIYSKNNKDTYLEELIFQHADLKDSYFKEYNNKEYSRRLNYLGRNIDITSQIKA